MTTLSISHEITDSGGLEVLVLLLDAQKRKGLWHGLETCGAADLAGLTGVMSGQVVLQCVPATSYPYHHMLVLQQLKCQYFFIYNYCIFCFIYLAMHI